MADQPQDAAAEAGARARALYELNRTTVFASRVDPRFSYCMYVPPKAAQAAGQGAGGLVSGAVDLVVAVHGTARTFQAYRDAFAEFGLWNDCIVLCPLFPVGVRGDGNAGGYKYVREGDIRYDLVLLDMVEEVGARYGLVFERFGLFGYSGGGHFVHRFFMLHPDRLWAVSIGAPGSVTLLDPSRDWWVGTRDLRAAFGRDIDEAAMRRVPVQMLVGALDTETWEITHREGGRYWMPGANDAGATRPERLAALRRSFEAAGITVRFDTIPGMAHDGVRAIGTATPFFADVLSARRFGRG